MNNQTAGSDRSNVYSFLYRTTDQYLTQDVLAVSL
jgi:hypothetical protein